MLSYYEGINYRKYKAQAFQNLPGKTYPKTNNADEIRIVLQSKSRRKRHIDTATLRVIRKILVAVTVAGP